MKHAHGTLETVDGRAALRFERRLPHSVERVWRAVSEPAELALWFVATPSWTPARGETFASFGEHGEVTELDPPRRLAWTWGVERFSFDLHPDADGCRLVFVHVLGDRAHGAQHAAGWEAYLGRLDALLAGTSLSEEAAHACAGEVHEGYAARFGQDPALGRRGIAQMAFRDLALEEGPVLRLERRFTQPIERVWRAVAEERAHWFPSGEALEVTTRESPRLLEGRWFGDRLRFELRAEGAGCVLSFSHAFADRDTAARTAAGWDRCFARMDALLGGAPLGEAESLELWPLVHERYAAGFGIDPELGRRAFAGHPLT